MLRQLSCTFLLCLALFFVCGCEQKELCYGHNHASNIRITFDWSNDTTANPSSMLVYLFPKDEDVQTLKREFIGDMGGYCHAMAGVTYSALAFNSDTRNLLFSRNPSFRSMESFLDDANMIEGIGIPASEIPKFMGTEKQRIVKEADSLWSAVSEKDIFITQEQYATYDLTLFPKRLFRSFKIIVKEIKNQDKVSPFMVGSLSGLSDGVNLSTGEGTEEPAIVDFGMRITQKKTLEGRFLCFGNVADVPNKLVIYTILQDGTKLCYAYDVSKQVAEAPDPYNVEIVIDSLPIPNKINGNSGVTPGMNDWSVIYIPISM